MPIFTPRAPRRARMATIRSTRRRGCQLGRKLGRPLGLRDVPCIARNPRIRSARVTSPLGTNFTMPGQPMPGAPNKRTARAPPSASWRLDPDASCCNRLDPTPCPRLLHFEDARTRPRRAVAPGSDDQQLDGRFTPRGRSSLPGRWRSGDRHPHPRDDALGIHPARPCFLLAAILRGAPSGVARSAASRHRQPTVWVPR